MNDILSIQQKEDFLIRLYFDTSKGFELAAIKRAFLDFSRTLKIVDQNRIKLKEKAEKYLLEIVKTDLNHQISHQEEFDEYHKKWCLSLKEIWHEISIGQSQKWINMTLKYWLLFGDSRIKNIELNAKYFHIPIDRYVKNEMFEKKSNKPWSKISEYSEYLEYQIEHRKKQTGNFTIIDNFPIIDEFNFFNGYIPKK
jgi:hypothetical protein